MSTDHTPSHGDEAARRAADPQTPHAELHELAANRPDLRPVIAENPHAYPALVQWLEDLHEPEITAALERRRAASNSPGSESAQEQPTESFGAVRGGEPHRATGPVSDEATAEHEPVGPQYAAANQGPAPAHYGFDPDRAHYAAAPSHGGGAAGPAIPGQYVYAEEEEPPRKRGGGCLVIVLLVLLTAGALGLSYALLFGNPFSDSADEQTVQQEPDSAEGQGDAPADEAADPDAAEQPPEDEASPAPEDEDSPEETEDADDQELERPAPDASAQLSSFSAPSGNILCETRDDAVYCTVLEYQFETPPGCDGDVTVRVDEEGDTALACGEPVTSSGAALNYGDSAATETLACTSTEVNVECWSQVTGDGFTIAREVIDFVSSN